jgi:NADP-dependent 3-hydroxy acid dehydrogenase YdfG
LECFKKKVLFSIQSLSPGVVKTDISPEMLKSVQANLLPCLEPEDISQGVLYVLGTPPRVQVIKTLILLNRFKKHIIYYKNY